MSRDNEKDLELGEAVIEILTEKIDNAKEILFQTDFILERSIEDNISMLRDALCDHEDIKYQSNEPENNITQGAWCKECNKEMEWEDN